MNNLIRFKGHGKVTGFLLRHKGRQVSFIPGGETKLTTTFVTENLNNYAPAPVPHVQHLTNAPKCVPAR